jgi:hypothetical protein
MFGNHRLLKVAKLRSVLAGILLAAPAAKAQSSREKLAASYFARGIEWQAGAWRVRSRHLRRRNSTHSLTYSAKDC